MTDVGTFLAQCARERLTPEQAMHILFCRDRAAFKIARTAIRYSKFWSGLFTFLSSPEGLAWLRQPNAVEDLFTYLRRSLIDDGH